jgi:uncharacterized membrane protein (UPF0136 family)
MDDSPKAGRISDVASSHINFSESKAILIVAIFGIVILLPLIVWGIPAGGDLTNHYRFALPFSESIRSGNLYPGWLAESNNGFGDARFRFYPPGLYYLLAGFKLVTGWYWASVLAFTLLSILGGLGMYFWARGSYSVQVAMWSGLFYIIAPYHLNEIYQASLLSEYAACAVLPFVFGFAERTIRLRGTANVAGLAASYAILVVTNLPLAVIGSWAVLVYAVFLLRPQYLRSNLIRLAMGVFVGLLASSSFWTSVIWELPWIRGSSVHVTTYYDYRSNFLFSPAALTNRNTWYANLLALAVVGFLLPALILLKKKATSGPGADSVQPNSRSIAILTVFSFLMATELSRPLWLIIPKLRDVEFPWRWLAITSMAGSILLGASIPRWKQLRRIDFRPVYLVPLMAIVLSLFFIITQIVWDSDYLSRARFNSVLVDIRGTGSIKDWMPAWVTDNLNPYLMKDRVEANSRKVTIESWEPEQRIFQIAAGPPTDIRVRTFYYPLWKASTGNQTLATKPAADGALLISLPAEASRVTLSFTEPARVQKFRVVTAVGWMLIAVLCFFDFRRAKFAQRPGSVAETIDLVGR